MDDIVLSSMLKWPNVPSVYGWLRLDRRGRWLIRKPDAKGRVSPAAAPGVQAGAPRFERIVNPAMIEFIGRNYTRDAEGRYFFQNGPQRVFVALEYTPWIYCLDGSGQSLVAHTGAGHSVRARLAGAEVMVGAVRTTELAARFGFVKRPVPPEGRPDC